MLFVDTNIFMYAVGKDHPFKEPALQFFRAVAEGDYEVAINAEVLQEILYRFWAIKKKNEGFVLFEYAASLADWIFPVTQEDAAKAKELMSAQESLPPRDALHAATMMRNKVATVVSYDQHLDLVLQIKRIEPPGK